MPTKAELLSSLICSRGHVRDSEAQANVPFPASPHQASPDIKARLLSSFMCLKGDIRDSGAQASASLSTLCSPDTNAASLSSLICLRGHIRDSDAKRNAPFPIPLAALTLRLDCYLHLFVCGDISETVASCRFSEKKTDDHGPSVRCSTCSCPKCTLGWINIQLALPPPGHVMAGLYE